MPKSLRAFFALTLSFYCLNLWAQESLPEVNIGPPHIERTDSYSEVNAPEIEHSSAITSEDLLRSVPGVSVSRSGGIGQSTLVFIRGADSEGTLVLLDGLPLNDPSLNNKAFDFSMLSLDNIERVEVWKGPQSVLFGSGATGGVINIVTKKGQGPLTLGATLLGGSQNTTNGIAFAQGSSRSMFYSLSAGRERTKGISAAAGGSEKDSSAADTASARVGWAPLARTSFEFNFRWGRRTSDLDYAPSPVPPGFTEVDAPNFHATGRTLALALGAHQDWSDKFESNFSISRLGQERTYNNTPDPENPGFAVGKYIGEAYHVQESNRWRLAPGLELLFGPSADFERVTSDYTTSTYKTSFPNKFDSLGGFMARAQYDQRYVYITGGSRWDYHSLFGYQTDSEFSPGVHLTPTTDLFLRGATAYKAPTLFELFDPYSGNEKLRPEHVVGTELSLTQSWDSRHGKAQISLFNNRYSNLIEWEQLHYHNVNSAVVRGAEIEVEQRVQDWLALQYTETFLNTRDDSTGGMLVRRPRASGAGKVEWISRPRLGLRAGLEYVGAGRRPDVDPVTGTSLTDASYEILNATISWQPSEQWKLYAKALNLFDRKYQEVAGYGSDPLSVYVGATFAWCAGCHGVSEVHTPN